jgi:transketolase
LWGSEGREHELALIATGSEVNLAQTVAEAFDAQGVGVRVVSMVSWEVFDSQPGSYRERVLPASLKHRVSIEAGVTVGWEHYVGLDGLKLGVDDYGESASEADLYHHFGLTPESVLEAVRKMLQ